MKTTLKIFAACAAAFIAVASVRAADWTDNYSSAVAQAKKEHKFILLNFTGSDWCPWCVKTDKEVFDTRKFKDFADKKLVLVTVDFPNNKVLPDAVKTQNDKLKDKFGIQAFPTLIVLNSDEKVVGSQLGYKDGGPDSFIARFPSLQ